MYKKNKQIEEHGEGDGDEGNKQPEYYRFLAAALLLTTTTTTTTTTYYLVVYLLLLTTITTITITMYLQSTAGRGRSCDIIACCLLFSVLLVTIS